ncbi:MAG: amidase [Candidatus Binatia bacterium]
MAEAWNRTARGFADAIRKKEISSSEAVEACLARIEDVNPKLNAMVHRCADRAREEAKAADAALARGEVRGPLHGVPMSIKDSFDTAGVPSTWATTGRKGTVPSRDATIVARLRAAGAILLGKTNTPELTLSFETDNLIFGRTSNPYDLTRSSGGSSGGAASLIAAGGTPFDIGTDTGGSVRLPSHWCGIAGIRPTSGRVPRTGHAVDFGTIYDATTTIGPMARSVDDLSLILPIIAGPDGIDPAIVPASLGDPAAIDAKKLRVAFFTDNGIATPTAETQAAVRAAAKALGEAGAVVEEARPEGISEALELFMLVFTSDAGYGIRAMLEACGTTQISPAVQGFLSASPETSASEVGRRIERWDKYRRTMLGFFGRYDAIVCPANAGPAMKHGFGPEGFEKFAYTMAFNLTGWPGTVVRCGTSPENLPIGLQVVTAPWREDISLALAKQLESAFGGWQKPAL